MELKYPIVYAVKHKDEQVRKSSRSGGIFTAVSDLILEMNGVVYGCVLAEDLTAVHVRSDNIELRNAMRGSKYLQSNMGNIFKLVKKDLDNGLNVLFSGTTCQVAGLKAFLGNKYVKLICIDIVCHGVPSEKVYIEYLSWLEDLYNAKCTNINFRNKEKYGWREHIETITLEKDNGEIMEHDSYVFRKLFLSHEILRPSCYICPYKSIVRNTEITIGDYWGIEKVAPDMDDNKGISLVLINNSIGLALFNSLSKDLDFRSCHIEDSMQRALQSPYSEPKGRVKFWKDFRNHDFGYIIKKYIKEKRIKSFVIKCKNKTKRVIKGLICRREVQ